MGRIPTAVGLMRGDGLVARFGNVVIYLAGASPSTERILGAAETAATAADPGVAIAQRLAATVFSSGSAQPPSFGVVAPTAGGILVLLRGPIRAVVDGPEGTRQLSGVRAMTWVDEILRDPVRKLAVAAETDPGTVIAHTDLRSGVVAAGGFIVNAPPSGITTQPRATAAPKPAPPETHPATPTYDSTKRAPIPTPSHTRFSSPGGSEALQRDSAADIESSTPTRHTSGDSEPIRRAAGASEPVRPTPDDSERNRRRAATTPAVPPPEETQAISALEAEESRAAADLPNLTKAVRHNGTPANSAAAETHLDAADQPPTAAHDSKAAAAEEEPPPR